MKKIKKWLKGLFQKKEIQKRKRSQTYLIEVCKHLCKNRNQAYEHIERYRGYYCTKYDHYEQDLKRIYNKSKIYHYFYEKENN